MTKALKLLVLLGALLYVLMGLALTFGVMGTLDMNAFQGLTLIGLSYAITKAA